MCKRIKMLLFLCLIKIGRFFLFRVSGIRRISATFRLFEEESLTNFCDIVATATANESVKKAISLLSKTTTCSVHHAFFLHFLPSLHDYEVKMPNFKFYVGRKQATSKFFLKWCFRCRRLRLPDCFESSLHCDNIVANKTVLVTSL